MTLTDARLSVIAVAEAPVMERDARFHFSDGSLRVLMQTHVNGFPLVLTGWNVGMPQGRRSSTRGGSAAWARSRERWVDVVLPAGEHDVMLTSFDPSGLFHRQTLRYARRCQ